MGRGQASSYSYRSESRLLIMKYAMVPTVWEESAEALDAAGHTQVELSENPDFVFFSGKTPDFPEELPESVKFIQVPLLAWMASWISLRIRTRSTVCAGPMRQVFMTPRLRSPPSPCCWRSCTHTSAWHWLRPGLFVMRPKPTQPSFLKTRPWQLSVRVGLARS